MKRKYWIPVTSLLLLLDVLLIAGCNRPTTQTISTPLTTATTLNVPTITASDAHNLIQKNIGNPGFVILDARTADEFNSGYIAGAINMDYYSPQFKTDVNKLPTTLRSGY